MPPLPTVTVQPVSVPPRIESVPPLTVWSSVVSMTVAPPPMASVWLAASKIAVDRVAAPLNCSVAPLAMAKPRPAPTLPCRSSMPPLAFTVPVPESPKLVVTVPKPDNILEAARTRLPAVSDVPASVIALP